MKHCSLSTAHYKENQIAARTSPKVTHIWWNMEAAIADVLKMLFVSDLEQAEKSGTVSQKPLKIRTANLHSCSKTVVPFYLLKPV